MAEAKGKKVKEQATDSVFLESMGCRIKEIRQRKGMTQLDLAYKIGMEKSNLSVIENGKSNPQILTLVKIASAMEVHLSDIFSFGFDYLVFHDAPQEYVPRKHSK